MNEQDRDRASNHRGGAEAEDRTGREPQGAPGPEALEATLELQVDRMAHGGEALGRDAEGRVVFVEGALPGEKVRVRLTETRDRHARGVLAEIPRPAADARRMGATPCPYFGSWPERGLKPSAHCGGCNWQHVDYAAQLRFKREIMIDALRRIGRIDQPEVAATLGMDEPWGYRNHLRLGAGEGGIGLVALDGHSRLAIEGCPIAHPLVEELLDELELELPDGAEISLRAGLRTGERMIELRTDPDRLEAVEVELDASVVILAPDGRVEVAAGRPWLTEELGGRPFTVPAGSFFQVNTLMAERVVEHLRQILPAGRMLADVYAGVGSFACLLADRFEEVAAIESDPAAVAAAVDNAAGLEHLSLLEADAAEGLDHLGDAPDVLLVDPPRGGLSKPVGRLLAQHPAHTIAYVSCEPSTLARDARYLVEAGWRLEHCQPIDMFPQTYHIESINLFRRAGR